MFHNFILFFCHVMETVVMLGERAGCMRCICAMAHSEDGTCNRDCTRRESRFQSVKPFSVLRKVSVRVFESSHIAGE